jgi:hypothetical protein
MFYETFMVHKNAKCRLADIKRKPDENCLEKKMRAKKLALEL